jgi:DNA-binding NarL/FixJ family response regulator
MKAGAKGYVVKTDAPEHLIDAARTIVKGGHYISIELAQNMAMEQFSSSDNPLDILSPREFEIFRRLAQGESLTYISESLHIGYKTTANVQTQIRQKLGVETTAQLVHLAIHLGIVQK